MTPSQIKLAKRILDTLHELDGGQIHAVTIHGEIGGLIACTTAEFDDLLAELDREKLILGVKTKYQGVLWSLSPAGQAARLQM